ncbi:MAG: hypothetical protein IT305_17960 [Chloroflexi bacterium]|nr:hypothetical protein [Chloroflexota bacterium]
MKSGFLPMLDAEVTNQDSSMHSFTVQATFLKGGQLVAVMSGAVNDLAAGQTKTASLMGQGSSIAEYDEILVAVDTLVK